MLRRFLADPAVRDTAGFCAFVLLPRLYSVLGEGVRGQQRQEITMTDNPPAGIAPRSAPPSAESSRLSKLLDNPLVGFAPWIALSVLEGPGRLELAAGVALAMSVVFVVLDRLRGRTLKLLGVVDVTSFTALLVIGALLSTADRHWLETWFGEVSNILLVLVVAGSMLARVPFTIQYAREEVDREHWTSPLFIRINYIITGAWGLAFLVSAIAGFYGDAVLHNNNNLWTAWIIQIGADLIAVQFTNWYPERATAVALQSAGQPTEPPAPIAALLLPVAGYLIPIGIVSLSADGGPDWIGYAFIAAGVLSTRWLHQQTGTKRPKR